jgi:hypothetical protein
MKTLITIFFLLLPLSLSAEYLRVPYEGIRPLGMGNAYLALADDANALWYNPAGLTQVKGVHFDLFNFTGGVDSANTLDRVYSAVFQGNYSGLISPSQEFLRFNANPTFVCPYFGFMLFDNMQGMFNIQELSLPTADIYAVNDFGALMAFAVPVGDYLSFGASVRAFERTGVDTTLSPQQLIAELGVPSSNFTNSVYNYLQGLAGTGYGIGLNLGMLLKVPMPSKTNRLQFGATVEDVGNTTIHRISGGYLPYIPMTYNFGAAFTNYLSKDSQLNFTADYRDAFSTVPLFEQVHLGAEFRIRYMSFRAGYYEAYPTFGFGLETPVHTRINLLTYAVEEGSARWQDGQRIYMAQLIIGFNPY